MYGARKALAYKGDIKKLMIMATGLLLANLALSAEFECPEKSLLIYSCKSHAETAVTPEVKKFARKSLVCYSSANHSYTVVFKDAEGDVSTNAANSEVKKSKLLLDIHDISSLDLTIATLEIETQVSGNRNATLTLLLPENEMKMSCLKTR